MVLKKRISMYKDLKKSLVASIAMETETIQKNGVSPKDLIMSRRNNLIFEGETL
jgi:hypothetical protein